MYTWLNLVNKNNVKVFYYEELPSLPKAIVVLNHGFRRHAGQFKEFTQFLKKSGYGVYAYDQRGHGRSEEERGHLERYEDFIDDLDAVIDLVKANHPQLPIYTFGHSMGGFISFVYGILHPEKLQGQIFSAPALGAPWGTKRLPDWIFKIPKKFFPKLKLYPFLKRPATRNKDFAKSLLEDPYVLKYSTFGFMYEFIYRGISWAEANADKYTLPCLFLHSKDDKIIPYDASVNIYQKIASRNKAFKSYNVLYHELLQEPERETVMKDIVNWLEKER